MIIGTAGHIDHGKTSLVRALTGVDTDRLKEEKVRGISIDLGFAYLAAADGSILGFIDVPGHEKFIHNMLAGATGIDFVLLVIAGDDGIMPQTREHMAIIDLLGIRRGVVALTKCDLLTQSQQSDVLANVRNFLTETSLADVEIFPVSTLSGEGIEDLRARLFAAASEHSARAIDGRFRLAVDRSFTLAGIGTVVTGTVLSGSVSTNDQVLISPSGLSARVRSIHAQNRPSERGVVGQRCALNLVGEGVSKDAITRGQIVMDPHLHAPADRIDVSLQVLATEKKPVVQWMPVRLHHSATEVGARVVLLGDSPIAPGGHAFAQLVLDRPIAAAVGDPFVIRDTNAGRTIGGGKFIDLRAPARKRRTEERHAQLQAYAQENDENVLAALLGNAPHFIDLTAFGRDRALSEKQVQEIGERVGIVKVTTLSRVFALSTSYWGELKSSLIAFLKSFHDANPDAPGVGIERLRVQLVPRLSAAAFLSLLNLLIGGKEIALDGARVSLIGHEVKLTPEDAKIWNLVAPLIDGADRFRPPRLRDMATKLNLREAELKRLFKLLASVGRVDEIVQDRFFTRSSVGEMVQVISDLSSSAADGQFTAAQFRDRMNNGRSLAIQILEFFDRHGVTLRRGDLRRVNRPKLERFRATPKSANAELCQEEENRPRWGGRTSNPEGAASRSLVGSTPSLFRQNKPTS